MSKNKIYKKNLAIQLYGSGIKVLLNSYWKTLYGIFNFYMVITLAEFMYHKNLNPFCLKYFNIYFYTKFNKKGQSRKKKGPTISVTT